MRAQWCIHTRTHTHTYTKSSQQETARIPYKTSNFFLGSIANDPMTSNKTLPLKGIAAFHSDTLSTKLPVCRSLIDKPDSNHSSPHLSGQMQSHASIGSYGSSGQGASVQDPQDPYHRQLPADQWAISAVKLICEGNAGSDQRLASFCWSLHSTQAPKYHEL